MIAPSQKQRSVTYEQVCQSNTLRDAWRLVRRGGISAGVDGQTLDQFAVDAQRGLRQIESELRGRRYCFLPVRRTFIAKLTGGKHGWVFPRSATALWSRRCGWRWSLSFPAASPPHVLPIVRGAAFTTPSMRLLQQRRKGRASISESDVEDFFDSICHPALLGQLQGLGVDEWLVELVADFLGAGSRLGSRWFASRRGVPQGSPLSPMLANLYLVPFDRALLNQNYELIRYADDLVVCCGSRREAQRAEAEMTRQLDLLQLSVNRKKTAILDSRQRSFEFLGFVIGPHSLRPNDASVKRFRQAITDVVNAWQGGSSTLLIEDLNRVIRGFGQHYQRCGAVELFRELDEFVHHQVMERFGASRWALDGLVLLDSYLGRAGRPSVERNLFRLPEQDGTGPAADFGPYSRAIHPPLQKRRMR